MNTSRQIVKFTWTQGLLLGATGMLAILIVQAFGKAFPFIPVIGCGVALLVFNVFAFLLYFRVLQSMPKTVTMYLMLIKVIRMLLCVMFIAAYGMLGGPSLLTVAATVLAFYLVALVHESIFYVRMEKKLKESV
mgnify:FL=1